MNPTIRDIPTFTRSASFEPSTVDAAKRTVDMVWTTGARVLRSNYYDGPFFEELSLDPKHVRMGRLSSGAAPFLKDHNRYDIGSTLGVIESARLEKGRGVATVRFPKEGIDPEADKVFQKIADGILRNVSVGYANYKFEKVEGGADKTPVFRAVDWEPQEVSLVTIGADAEAGFRAADVPTNPCEFVTTRGMEPHEESEAMKTTPNTASSADPSGGARAADPSQSAAPPSTQEPAAVAVDIEAVRAAERKAERERIEEIGKMVRTVRLGDEFARKLIADGASTKEASTLIFGELARRDMETDTRSMHPVTSRGEDAADKRFRGMSAALLQRTGFASTVKAAIDRGGDAAERLRGTEMDPGEFRGISVLSACRELLEARGVRTARMSNSRIYEEAISRRGGYQTTADFATLFENVMNKAVLAAYAVQEDTWRSFCGTDKVPDFKASTRYRTGSLDVLDSLGETGEYKNKAIPDGQKQSISTATKGNIYSLSRQVIINDDMGALADLFAKMGRAAARTLEEDVYALLIANSGLGANLDDGNPFFHASRANVNPTGSLLSVSGLDSDRVLMLGQKDISNREFLDLAPAVLLVPLGQGGDARVINDMQYDDATSKFQKPNKVRGLFRDIKESPRLSGARRYLFADPTQNPAIKVVFLEESGEAPVLSSEDGWRTDGVEYKVRIDAKAQFFEPKAAVTNSGAA